MSSRWRLVDTGRRSAAENMALDEAMLTARAEGRAADTLRFMQFSPHAVLVGVHQSVELEVREEFCREAGIDINRRITGGGAIYFDESQLGWEVVAKRQSVRFRSPEELYRLMCGAVVNALRELGIEASFRPRNDIEVEGRKISGTGGTFEGDAFLFQGTLLMDFDVETMLRALRIPAEKLQSKEIESVKERVTCLREQLGYLPELEEVKRALVKGFEQALGVELVRGELSSREEELFRELLPRFSSPEWIYGVRKPPEHRAVLQAVRRCQGGVVRAQLVVDVPARRVQYAFITGDFYAFPRRAIPDLEARLRDIEAEPQRLAEAVHRFFRETGAQVPGVGWKGIAEALVAAVQKLELLEQGLRIEDTSEVFTVLGSFEEIPEAEVLLLPYCAKPGWCEYRHREDCGRCGRCSVGRAYELAERLGLRVITITNYEHLEETLRSLKQQGVRAFLGSCCESFYVKHQQDFERFGVRGVLVDINSTTCYDLGRVREAKAGRFEGETELNLQLLERVLRLKTRRSG
ncbi:MAG: DUF116 domain-containing protein [Euryarchaeota archaeon]|nr:DUF116 domain-containing protein [Euryarchaeota archaeon]